MSYGILLATRHEIDIYTLPKTLNLAKIKCLITNKQERLHSSKNKQRQDSKRQRQNIDPKTHLKQMSSGALFAGWYIHTPQNPKLSKNIILDYEYARKTPFSIKKKKDKIARENERTFTQ